MPVHRAPTKIRVANPLAKHVSVDNFKIKMVNPLAKHVPVDNSKTKVRNPLARHVPVVVTVLLVP